MRINIPGSRPIPPVVLRTQAPGSEGGEGVQGGQGGQAAAGSGGGSAGTSGGNGDRPTVLPPGWEFPGGGAQSAPGHAAPAAPAASGPSGGQAPGEGGTGGGGGSGGGRSTSDWFAPRKGGQPSGPGAPQADPETTGQHRLPQQGQGQPQGHPPAPGQVPQPQLPSRPRPGAPAPPAARSDEPQQNPFVAGLALSGEMNDPRGGGGPADPRQVYGDPPGGGYPGEPRDPGPGYRQQGPPPTAGGPGPGGPGGPSGPGVPGGPGPGGLGGPGLEGPHGPDSGNFPSYRPPVGTPAGPTTGPGTGEMMPPPYQSAPPPPSLYTQPQQQSEPRPEQPGPGPGPAAGYRPASGDLSSDTLVSGIPAVQPQPYLPAAAQAPRPAPDSESDSLSDDSYRFEGDDDAPRGRSKVILAAVALLGLVGIAYGAGLLLDHADVPKGTTVLGVDIGGKSKPEAIKALDSELGKRAVRPIPVRVGAEKEQLDPRVAGLGIDTTVTVRNVAHRDYNPVSVIGSLLGGEREAEAAFVIDDDKLRAALKGLSAKQDGKGGQDGMVKFVDGKPVGVPGKPSLALDVNDAVGTVREAYIARAGSGANPPVELSRVQQEPKVDQAEIDRAIKEFGEPAMSGLVTVKAGAASISFSPEKSLPKFLSMRPSPSGKLEPYFDLPALEELYGSVFDGVTVDHGGSAGPITPRDVAVTMLPALKETEPAKRVGVMEVVD